MSAIVFSFYRVELDDIADADRDPFASAGSASPSVTLTYDPPAYEACQPPFTGRRMARGSTAPCTIPSLVDERAMRAQGDPATARPGGPSNSALVHDLSSRTITAELHFEQTDYESLEWELEWRSPW